MTDHSLLLLDNGAAVAFGDNTCGQCDVPPLAAGRRYVAAAAGASHSLLLLDNGAAVAFGANGRGQCDVPPLAAGQRWEQIRAVLLAMSKGALCVLPGCCKLLIGVFLVGQK